MAHMPADLKTRYEHLIAVRNGTETYRYFPATYNYEAALMERIAGLSEALDEIIVIAEREYIVTIGNQWAWARVEDKARAALEKAKGVSE